MIAFFNYFVKITGIIPAWIVFRTKVYYEDKKKQSRFIKGKAIIISNHTSVWDYGVFLFVFFFRTLRYQMAEVLYKKKILALFLKCMGGIYVNRDTHDFSFMHKSEEILDKGGVVGIFPESRLPLKDEERPLPFKPSAAYLALVSNTPIVPVYTNGEYFSLKRARVMIGAPILLNKYYDESLTEEENISRLNDLLRNKIIELRDELNGRRTSKEK